MSYTFSQTAQLFEEFLQSQSLFNRSPKELYKPCDYLLQSGGKRVRPSLCLMAHELYQPLKQEVFYAALALELFHNFTLIHDDIMDKAPMRRGRATVHVKYGLSAGILSGDVMNIYAYRALEAVSADQLSRLFPLFNKTAIEVCEGQQLDANFETLPWVKQEDYIEMITLKTSVLLAVSLQIGAILGGADADQCLLLYELGKHLGIAFQLQDDYLDAFGEASATGKQAGGDILEGKKTILHTLFWAKASKEDQAKYRQLFEQKGVGMVAQITALYRDYEVDQSACQMVELYTHKAFNLLKQLEVASTQKMPLMQFAEELLHRKA